MQAINDDYLGFEEKEPAPTQTQIKSEQASRDLMSVSQRNEKIKALNKARRENIKRALNRQLSDKELKQYVEMTPAGLEAKKNNLPMFVEQDKKLSTETYSKPIAITYSKPGANLEQTYSKPIAETYSKTYSKLVKLHHLSGVQKDVIVVLYSHTNSSGNRTTDRLSIKQIASEIDHNKSSDPKFIAVVRNAITRLRQKFVIERTDYKDGRGGWSQYLISENIFSELFDESKPIAKPIANDAYTSSGLNKTTTRSNTKTAEYKRDWSDVDISPLSEIKFRQSHVNQLRKSNCTTPEKLEESIKHFAYKLKHLRATYRNPVSVFMSVMKREGEWFEPRYNPQNPQTENKAREAHKKDDPIAMDSKAFETWLTGLDESERAKILTEFKPISKAALKMQERSFLFEQWKKEKK